MKNSLNNFFILGLILFIATAIFNCLDIYTNTIADYEIFGNMASYIFNKRFEQIYIMITFIILSIILILTLTKQKK